MCAAQSHRGPDSRGVHVADGVGLGIQRLRVIDLETGDQPIYNEDRSVVVVLNGEIYNYRELREELSHRGHRFATAADTEVIVHLYEELGTRCVDRLQGMFAFALYDSKRGRLMITRDRVGKKPLFWAESEGGLTFASELGALLVDRSIPRELDPSSLDCFLAYGYIQAPKSIWRDVRKLEPGHTLTWSAGEVEVERYWRLDYSQKRTDGLPELEDELRSRISNAVRRRMIADVPLGAFLSGGIDSSIVVSEMAAQSSQPVKTFSIGFDDEKYNELPQARQVSQLFDTEHAEFTVHPDAVNLLPKLVRHYGEPYADSSAIPTFYLAELTKRHVTVALNGDGGDESFAGYVRYPANSLTGWVDRLPRSARRGVAAAATRLLDARERRGSVAYARRYLTTLEGDAAERYAAHVGIFDLRQRQQLLAPDLFDQIDPRRTLDVIRSPFESATGTSRLDRLLQTDVESYLPGDLLTKVDIATMAHSLEARSPFLDHELMEFAATIPANYKARGARKKWILRRAYRGVLPDSILDGPKRGFGVPLARWFRDELASWTREILLAPEVGGGMLNREAIRQLIDEHQTGGVDRSFHIWALLCLEQWRVQFG